MKEKVDLRQLSVIEYLDFAGSIIQNFGKFLMRRVLRNYQSCSLSVRTVCPYPVLEGLPFRLARRLPFENICLPGGAFSCTWPGVGYGLSYVAEIEMKSNILEFFLRSGPRGFARTSCRTSTFRCDLFDVLWLRHERDSIFRSSS